MSSDKIWLSPPHIDSDELLQVKKAFESNYIAPVGPQIDQFERDLCDITGASNCAALSSGTAALHLALILLGVEPGDEVIVSTLTFAASVYPIVYLGAKPVLVDSEKETANMSPEFLEEAIKDRIKQGKKPKAIILVHLYGMPANLESISDIASNYGIPIIEDAAEALGSKYKGKDLGTFGELGIFSFNGNKIITTSGGGALVSKNKGFIDRAKKLSSQARDPAPHYQHSEIGYNYRMSNVCAAIGIGQLKSLEKKVERRRLISDYYKQELQHITSIQMLDEPNQDYYSNHWLSWFTIEPSSQNTVTTDQIRIALDDQNIEARPLWKPMQMQPVFSHCIYFGDKLSEWLFHHSLCLPSGSDLTEQQLERITGIVRSFF